MLPCHPSVDRLWRAYLATLGETPSTTDRSYTAWHFCDNEADANECLRLVLRGVKCATTPALSWLRDEGLPVPSPGDLSIVTDWDGIAHAVIRTTQVDIVPLRAVTPEHAAAEGEGDGTLADWHRIHDAFYRREADGRPYTVSGDMLVVCERFDRCFPPSPEQRLK